MGGGFEKISGLWGMVLKKIGSEGADFFCAAGAKAAKPPKIDPPLGEFFSVKMFIVGKYFRGCFA